MYRLQRIIEMKCWKNKIYIFQSTKFISFHFSVFWEKQNEMLKFLINKIKRQHFAKPAWWPKWFSDEKIIKCKNRIRSCEKKNIYVHIITLQLLFSYKSPIILVVIINLSSTRKGAFKFRVSHVGLVHFCLRLLDY